MLGYLNRSLVKTIKEVAMIERREPSREEIARQAHELYVQRGGEHGKNVEDWVRAERALRDEPAVRPVKTKAAQASRMAVN
jgi:Protein of unknown function (DUF2934)